MTILAICVWRLNRKFCPTITVRRIFAAVSMILDASYALVAIGFSSITCLRAFKASMATCA